MRKLNMALTLVASLLAAHTAEASSKSWKSFFDHGETRAYVNAPNGHQLDVSCDYRAKLHIEYAASGLNVDNTNTAGLWLQVDNNAPVDATDDGSRAAANRLYALIAQLRRGKTVVVQYGNVHDQFTLKGSTAALPDVGEDCGSIIDAKIIMGDDDA